MNVRLDGRVAVITGAGSGLGRAHALGFAAHGARVVVNDIGSRRGSDAALAVVEEIRSAGGQAIAHGADVSDHEQVVDMVATAESSLGAVDILVANAGILLDRSFGKMTMEEFRRVIDVHLIGSANCAKAVWDGMKQRGYGRIVFTTSASGIYGNFGQANYGAAKAGVVGLMNVLHLEGARYGIRVNALAPSAATAMTKGLFPAESIDLLQPESITPGVIFLASEAAPSRVVLCAGGGCYAAATIAETEGVFLAPADNTPDGVASALEAIVATDRQRVVRDAFDQSMAYSERVVANRRRAIA